MSVEGTRRIRVSVMERRGVPWGGVSREEGCLIQEGVGRYLGSVDVDFFCAGMEEITHNPQEAIRYRGCPRTKVDDASDGRCVPWTMHPLDDASLMMSRGTGPHTEAGFWDENQTKASRVFLLAFHSFALRDFYFFKLTLSFCTVHCKGERRKT